MIALNLSHNNNFFNNFPFSNNKNFDIIYDKLYIILNINS